MEVKKILNFSILLVLLISLSCSTKNKTNVLYDKTYIEEIKTARRDVLFYMTRNFVPGATIAIAKEGKIIYSEGLGLASKDLEAPANRNSKFRVGQISELFTNLIYQKMVENGTLHPDSTVKTYVTDFPDKQYALPIRHLVNHTSGIREPNAEEQDWRAMNVTLEAGIVNFKNDSLVFPPGIYQVANRHNYDLLGLIMEKVTGEKFDDILKKYVTDTLGLENTLPDNPLITIKGRTDFYDHNFIAQVINATTLDMRFRAPSEGILSNAEDMVKFGNALLFSDYFSEEIKAKLFEPVTLLNDIPSSMANAWVLLKDRQGRLVYGRSGTVTGGGAALLVFPAEQLVVAYAGNLGSFSDDYPVFNVAQHFLDTPESKPEAEGSGHGDTNEK